jgi:hypothetical protein
VVWSLDVGCVDDLALELSREADGLLVAMRCSSASLALIRMYSLLKSNSARS